MKIKALKTGQSIKIGEHEKVYFSEPEFEIKLEDHLVYIRLKSKDITVITSLYNTVYVNELE